MIARDVKAFHERVAADVRRLNPPPPPAPPPVIRFADQERLAAALLQFSYAYVELDLWRLTAGERNVMDELYRAITQ